MLLPFIKSSYGPVKVRYIIGCQTGIMDCYRMIIGLSLDRHWTVIGQLLDPHWKVSPLYGHYTPTICPLYVHYMPTICQLYAHYMHTIYSLYAKTGGHRLNSFFSLFVLVYFEILQAPSEIPANLPDQFSPPGQIFLHWAAATLKGLVGFQNKKF